MTPSILARVAALACPSDPIPTVLPAPFNLHELKIQQLFTAAGEQQRMQRLVAYAEERVAAHGDSALLDQAAPTTLYVGGNGNDADLWSHVRALEQTDDVARMWANAARAHYHLTASRGSLWTIDTTALDECARIAVESDHPLKRALALRAIARTGWRDWRPLLIERLANDLDPRVRAVATRFMPAPEGVSASEARPILDKMLALLADADTYVRATAVTGAAPWVFTTEDLERVERMAREDPDPNARAAAAHALTLVPSPRARAALLKLGVVPDDL